MAPKSKSPPTEDPTLAHLPLPVRNIIPQIPGDLLSTLLTHHVQAYMPQEIKVTNITPTTLSLSYLQPVEDVAFAPVPRSTSINFTPPLPAIPSLQKCEKDSDAAYEWESACATRIKDMSAEAKKILEGRSDIIVDKYLPPDSPASFITAFQFIFLSWLIYIWARYGAEAPLIGSFLANKVFTEEWRFNMTTLFHAAILVKRWGDVLSMAKKLRKHGVDMHKRGRVLGPWVWWLLSAFFEGWRSERRFDGEVARIGRGMAEKKDGEGETKKGK